MKKFLLSIAALLTMAADGFSQAPAGTSLEYRPVQFSVTPGLGSNGKQSEQFYTSFSFGVLGDKSGGVSGLQLSGLINRNHSYAKGLQLAGLINTIGALPNPLHLAYRFNPDSTVSPEVNLEGLQLGGILNSVEGDANGVQIGGVINTVTGVLNGLQLGAINRTRHSKGLQIGVINIADSSSGATLGVVNIVRHGGYYRAELWAGETFLANGALKMGTQKLYSIFALGWGPHEGKHHFGYGLGLGFPVNPKGMFLDVLIYQVNENRFWTNGSSNLLEQVRLTKERDFGKIALLYGATLNVFVSNRKPLKTGEDPGMKLEPWPLFENISRQSRVAVWPGLNLGIRVK
ncbi:LA_2272 family surface repeat-containing protein [Rufibacter hautae]|uniref:Uncharacterized protein n=1 Tax=Rufibacter hautae TaxID=2595005 RepID=A0A5B6TCJ6_9BACT|nr:hypothetical protein [Rufibacter hautae]KAA3436709.1 hypothetical protein FOA19_20225 [Rufibacter hautae]